MYKNSKYIKYSRLVLALLLGFSLFVVSCGSDEPDSPTIIVDELKDSSAYVTKLYDYVYAPGQYATAVYSESPEDIVGKPTYLYAVTPMQSKSAVSLGGWGGYIVVGFNHDVQNIAGTDFIVLCGASPSAEAGVVYVMEDENQNQLPDDTWYELKGSEYDNSASSNNYKLTYYKPNVGSNYITWKAAGIVKDTLKTGSTTDYTAAWWKYSTLDSLVFEGALLPDTYYNSSTTATQHWETITGLCAWGYAENPTGTDYNTTYRGNEMDISNAVDASGNPHALSSIRFVKIQTAVFQRAGWLNEVSTEIYGLADLSLLGQ